MKKLLIVLFLFLTQASHAQMCADLFQEPVARQKRDLLQKMEALQSYHKKFTNFKLVESEIPRYQENIDKLAKQLFKDKFGTELNSEIVGYRSDSIANSNYHLFTYTDNTSYLHIRSNGYVAFLDKSWRYRKLNEINHHKMAYILGNKVISGQQTEFLLSTFKDDVILSRDMGRKERARWINGEKFYSDGKYGNKVHFAPNYFRSRSQRRAHVHRRGAVTHDSLLRQRLSRLYGAILRAKYSRFLGNANQIARTKSRHVHWQGLQP